MGIPVGISMAQNTCVHGVTQVPIRGYLLVNSMASKYVISVGPCIIMTKRRECIAHPEPSLGD